MEILGETLSILEKALDLRVANHRIIASNLANVDTPGYQASRLNFEASMQQAIDQIQSASGAAIDPTDPDVLAERTLGLDRATEPIIESTGEAPVGLDGNNVNMDAELGRLAENTAMYRLTAQLAAAKLRQLKMVIENSGS